MDEGDESDEGNESDDSQESDSSGAWSAGSDESAESFDGDDSDESSEDDESFEGDDVTLHVMIEMARSSEINDLDKISEMGDGDEGEDSDESDETSEMDETPEGDASDEMDETPNGDTISDFGESDHESDESFEDDDSDESSEDYEISKGDKTFFVVVGNRKKQWWIEVEHDIMTKRSKLFQFDRSTSKTNQIELPGHDRRTFEMYENVVRYDKMLEELYPRAAQLYEKKSLCERTEKQKEQYSAVLQAYHDDQYSDFVEVYSLANYLEDPTTANIVIDGIRMYMEKYAYAPSKKVIRLVLNSTEENDGLRLVFADFFVYQSGHRLDPKLPKEFFILVTQRYESMKTDQKIVVKKELVERFGLAVQDKHWNDFPDYYQRCESLEDQLVREMLGPEETS